jgi:hypothetical protein
MKELYPEIVGRRLFFVERFGSGDGERKTLLTRQIAFEPLPASVLFAFGWCCGHHRGVSAASFGLM